MWFTEETSCSEIWILGWENDRTFIIKRDNSLNMPYKTANIFYLSVQRLIKIDYHQPLILFLLTLLSSIYFLWSYSPLPPSPSLISSSFLFLYFVSLAFLGIQIWIILFLHYFYVFFMKNTHILHKRGVDIRQTYVHIQNTQLLYTDMSLYVCVSMITPVILWRTWCQVYYFSM